MTLAAKRNMGKLEMVHTAIEELQGLALKDSDDTVTGKKRQKLGSRAASSSSSTSSGSSTARWTKALGIPGKAKKIHGKAMKIMKNMRKKGASP